jgi:hypothetical protein
MTRAAAAETAAVGVSDHGGWAVLMTVGRDGTLLDRRRIELVDDDLPSLPHHHDAKRLPIEEGVKLVGRVRSSAERHARACLEALAGAVSKEIVTIALRACPPLPDTVAERITNYRASNVADWVMYRRALENAASERGWRVHWYDAKRVFSDAASALGRKTIDDLLAKTHAILGPPWQKDQKMAMAAAIAASGKK